MSQAATVRLSWCPEGMASQNSDNEIGFTKHETINFSELSELNDAAVQASTLLLPLEHLLTRTFSLPLKNTRLIDASILAQELADMAGTDPDEWWLSWKAGKTDKGVEGIIFALPLETKQAISAHPALQQTSRIMVDGWVRLNSWISKPEIALPPSFAIIDCDASGAFFAYVENGIWCGIRRLNSDLHQEQNSEKLGQHLVWSLQAMGFDKEVMPVIGRITPPMEALFPVVAEKLPRRVENALAERHLLNLQASLPEEGSASCMNLRHGKWAVKHRSSIPDQWKRPMVMAAMLSFIWLFSTVANNYMLEAQIAEKQDVIIDAFHRGLPDQPVIIDALAQLKQAAQQGGGATGSMNSTQQLSIISAAYQKQAWQMKEIKIDNEGTLITGVAESMEALNSIREHLSREAGREVKILDTDLSGNQVTFKVNWQ